MHARISNDDLSAAYVAANPPERAYIVALLLILVILANLRRRWLVAAMTALTLGLWHINGIHLHTIHAAAAGGFAVSVDTILSAVMPPHIGRPI